MKKSIKMLLCLITALSVAATVGGLTACGNNAPEEGGTSHTTHVDSDSDGKCDECGADTGTPDREPAAPEYKTPTKDDVYWGELAGTKGNLMREDVSTKEIAYQFSAIYEHVSNTQPTREYYLLINLYTDGYLRGYQYYDDGTLFEYGGYWLNEGADLGIWAGVLEYGLTMNNITSVYTYDWSNNLIIENGTFTFSFSISLGNADGGLYVRQASFTGMTGEVTYKTTQNWLDYLKEETGDTVALTDFSGWEGNLEDTAIVTITLTDQDGTDRDIEFFSDNTYMFGGLGGTWTISGTALALEQDTDNGSTWTVTANSDGTYTLAYAYNNEGGAVFEGDLSKADFTALVESQILADITLRWGGNADGSPLNMKLLADGTYNVKDGALVGTWQTENGTLTFDKSSVITYDAATKTLTISMQGSTFKAELTTEQLVRLGVVKTDTVTLRYNGNADGSPITMKVYSDGTFSVNDGAVTGTWETEGGVLVFSNDGITYNAATKTLTVDIQAVFKAVLTDAELEFFGLAG